MIRLRKLEDLRNSLSMKRNSWLRNTRLLMKIKRVFSSILKHDDKMLRMQLKKSKDLLRIRRISKKIFEFLSLKSKNKSMISVKYKIKCLCVLNTKDFLTKWLNISINHLERSNQSTKIIFLMSLKQFSSQKQIKRIRPLIFTLIEDLFLPFW